MDVIKKTTLFIYTTRKLFPEEERFGLTSQMRRSAISVCSNFAEGNAKKSGKEKARYTEISYCSLMELLNQGIISHELNYLDDKAMKKIRDMIDEIANKATKLKEYQLSLHNHITLNIKHLTFNIRKNFLNTPSIEYLR